MCRLEEVLLQARTVRSYLRNITKVSFNNSSNPVLSSTFVLVFKSIVPGLSTPSSLSARFLFPRLASEVVDSERCGGLRTPFGVDIVGSSV